MVSEKNIPQLGEGRGKVIVVSRNKELKGIPWSAFSVQDKFWINKGQSIDQKWQAVVQHFAAVSNTKKPSINFISCTGVFNPPNFTASKLNSKLITYLKDEVGKSKKSRGIVVVDFVSVKMFLALEK